MDIIKKIENNKNDKNKEINKILNINIDYTISFEDDKLILLDNNNNKILVGNFIFFGIYQSNNKIWMWGNSIPGLSKKQMNNIKDIRNKSYLFENNNDKNIDLIYQFLNSDMLEIMDNLKLNIIKDALLFISDVKVIFNPINKYGNIQYIGLTDIIEKYN
jgi:hypothetical protein